MKWLTLLNPQDATGVLSRMGWHVPELAKGVGLTALALDQQEPFLKRTRSVTRWSWAVLGLAIVALISGSIAWWWATQRTLPTEFARRFAAPTQGLIEVRYVSNDRLLVAGSASGAVVTWDLATDRTQLLEPSSKQPIVALGVSPDDVLVGSGLNGELRAWQMPEFKSTPLHSPEMPVTAMVFRKKNDLSIMLGLADGRIATVAAKKLTLRKSGHRGVKAMTLMPESDVLITAGTEGKLIWYDLKTETQLASVTEHQTEVPNLAWSADAKQLASGDWNGQLRIWDPIKHEVVGRARQPDAVVGLAWRDQQLITGSWDGVIRIWYCDASTPQLARSIDTGLPIHGLAVSADGSQVATVSNRADVEIWNLK